MMIPAKEPQAVKPFAIREPIMWVLDYAGGWDLIVRLGEVTDKSSAWETALRSKIQDKLPPAVKAIGSNGCAAIW